MTFALLLVCFFLSGFSALLYETAWSREFAFVFGTSELAVVAVLAAYMGGLAAGAALAARWATKVRRPVLAYGVLELGIALWALAIPSAIRALRALYLGWLGGLDALPDTLGALTHTFHLVGAFVVLVPCTALMGATLPLLARHAVTRDEQIGPRVGVLYATNTLGAIAGTIVAAFVLMPALGLRLTVWVGAGVNALVFAAAALLARRAPETPPSASGRRGAFHWILPAIGLSGAVSFAYEVLWFRLLGQLLGGSTAAFSTMLASFLAGIALGSAIASRWARSPASATAGFVCAQLATAGMACAGFAAADQLPRLAVALGATLHHHAPGAAIAAAALMPLTLCIGASFPFAVRILARDANDAAPASARIYAWNTAGSIVGAISAGYWLLPGLGLEGTLVLGAFLNLALAGGAALAARPRSTRLAAAAALGAMVLWLLPVSRPDRVLRYSAMGGILNHGEITHLGIGRSATVALFDTGTRWRLTTNGLPESWIFPPYYPASALTAQWLSLLPVLMRPELEEMLIIGLGGGITLQSVPPSVKSVEVIELEPEVVAANRVVSERLRGDPLADPRLVLRFGDARGALILTERRYDAIVSQPSHPWTSGASHLYTREFFSLVGSRLASDGVFVQWIGGGFVDSPRLRSVLAALGEVFEYVHLYLPPGGARVMLASNAPFDPVGAAARAIQNSPEHFAIGGLHRVEDLVSSFSLDAEGVRRFTGDARPNTDDRNQLASYLDTADLGSSPRQQLEIDDLDPLPGLIDRLDAGAVARRLAELGHSKRARALADRQAKPIRDRIRAWFALSSNRQLAAKHFRLALEHDPDDREAAIGLALVDAEVGVEALPERVQAVVVGRRSAGENPSRLRELEPQLASWKPGELLYREATELRVRWRIAEGSDERAREATRLIDQLSTRAALPRYRIVQALAASAHGRNAEAWAALEALSQSLLRRVAPAVAQRGLDLATGLGEPPNETLLPALRRAQLARRAPAP